MSTSFGNTATTFLAIVADFAEDEGIKRSFHLWGGLTFDQSPKAADAHSVILKGAPPQLAHDLRRYWLKAAKTSARQERAVAQRELVFGASVSTRRANRGGRRHAHGGELMFGAGVSISSRGIVLGVLLGGDLLVFGAGVSTNSRRRLQ